MVRNLLSRDTRYTVKDMLFAFAVLALK